MHKYRLLLVSKVFVVINTKNTRTADAERVFFLFDGILPNPDNTENSFDRTMELRRMDHLLCRKGFSLV